MSTMNLMILSSVRRMIDVDQLLTLREFASKNIKEGRTIQQAIEIVEAYRAWIDANYKNIISWLESNT